MSTRSGPKAAGSKCSGSALAPTEGGVEGGGVVGVPATVGGTEPTGAAVVSGAGFVAPVVASELGVELEEVLLHAASRTPEQSAAAAADAARATAHPVIEHGSEATNWR